MFPVSAPPSSIEMVGHPANSKIEIKENEEFKLECLVRNAKPAAKIIWYRGDVELKLGELTQNTVYNCRFNITTKNVNSSISHFGENFLSKSIKRKLFSSTQIEANVKVIISISKLVLLFPVFSISSVLCSILENNKCSLKLKLILKQKGVGTVYRSGYFSHSLAKA